MEKVQIYSDIYILVKNYFGIHGDDGIFWCLFARMMQATKELQDQVAQKTGMGPVSPRLVRVR